MNIDIDEKDKLVPIAVRHLKKVVRSNLSDDEWKRHKKLWQSMASSSRPLDLSKMWGFLLDSFYASDLPLTLEEKDDVLRKSVRNIGPWIWRFDLDIKSCPHAYEQMLCDRVSKALEDNINKLIDHDYKMPPTDDLVLARPKKYLLNGVTITATKEDFLDMVVGNASPLWDTENDKIARWLTDKYQAKNAKFDWDNVIVEKMRQHHKKDFEKLNSPGTFKNTLLAQRNIKNQTNLKMEPYTMSKELRQRVKRYTGDDLIKHMNDVSKNFKKRR